MERLAVVTGGGRGLGLSLVKELRARGYSVVATVRRASHLPSALAEPGVQVRTLDVSDEASIAAFARSTQGERISLVVHNAGVLGGSGAVGAGGQRLDDETMVGLLDAYRVNAAGPLLLTRALLPSLTRGAKVACITSRMGSIGEGPAGGSYAYRMSKAALNMMGANLAAELRPRGVVVVLVHPGWVKTDMGGAGARLDAADSARDVVDVVERATAAESGRFFKHDGTTIPW